APVHCSRQVAGRVHALRCPDAVRPAERPVVTATVLGAGGHELRTVRFIEGDVWCRVLWDVARMPRAERPGSPNVLRARVDRVRTRHRIRVTYLRPVEPNRFAAVHDRGGADDPSLRVAVAEIRAAEPARELVEAPRRIRRVVTGVTTVPVDHLRERLPQIAQVRPGAVVLRAAHHL